MEKETDTVLIDLLRDFVDQRPSSAVPAAPQLPALARAHQVAPIVYYQTKEKEFAPAYFQAISGYTQRQQLLSQIAAALGDIPYFTVKGLSTARYYPVPQLRTMSDCDIVVRECDKETAKQRLLAAGFVYRPTNWDHMEWHFEKQGLEIELHHRLLYDEFVNTEAEKAFTDTAWAHVREHEPDIDFQFVYALIHLKKHLMNVGAGVRQFMDLALMSKNAPLDPAVVSAYIEQVGLTRFAGVCSALCLRWFGVGLPVDTPELSDAFFAQATEAVLSGGVFGYAEPENQTKGFLNTVQEQGKLRLIRDHLFPSYATCCTAPKYQWIKGRPYLLPALWVYRFFWAIFAGKGRSSADYLSSVADSDKAIAERDQALEAWGL